MTKRRSAGSHRDRHAAAPTIPVYVCRILDAARQGFGHRGKVTTVEVWHDSYCNLFRGRGVCDCDPDIVFGYNDGRRADAPPMQALNNGAPA